MRAWKKEIKKEGKWQGPDAYFPLTFGCNNNVFMHALFAFQISFSLCFLWNIWYEFPDLSVFHLDLWMEKAADEKNGHEKI